MPLGGSKKKNAPSSFDAPAYTRVAATRPGAFQASHLDPLTGEPRVPGMTAEEWGQQAPIFNLQDPNLGERPHYPLANIEAEIGRVESYNKRRPPGVGAAQRGWGKASKR
jgi:hypothetical protein